MLPEKEKAKYYELAEEERRLHAQQHPDWSCRHNYVSVTLAMNATWEPTSDNDAFDTKSCVLFFVGEKAVQ